MVAPAGDPHGDAVQATLARTGIPVGRTSAELLTGGGAAWRLGADPLVPCADGQFWIVDGATTVWWRRLGSPSVAGLGQAEAQLVADEVPMLLVGLLEAAGVRWVDAPWAVDRASLKLHQLELARGLGLAVPRSLVTGDPGQARAFVTEVGSVVAKAVSSGVGIAPFAEAVPPEELDLVAACPTLLQESIPAAADLRVVTIGGETLVWRRERLAAEPVDWRRADPAGAGFQPMAACGLGDGPGAVAAGLGLTFSVQDWLESGDRPVFLEVNPCGNWLFLQGAAERVTPLLVRHLAGGTP